MNDINYPAWYQSTTGPGISQTIINIIGNVVPVLNLVLASHGVNIIPGALNTYVSLVVFIYFSVKAMIGYVKAKRLLSARVLQLGGSLRTDWTPETGSGSKESK